MHFHHTIIVLFLAWHAACQLPMDLWQDNTSPEWAAKPTWHKEQEDVGILDFNGVRDLAQKYFDWLIQQPSALTSNGNPADVLVAVFYDATFASSIPRGPRKAFMTTTVQQAAPNNFAPIWYEKAKGIFDAATGHNPMFRDAPIHAEDGAYFNWETSIHAALADNYPPGSVTLSVQTGTQVTAPAESCAFTALPGASAQITTTADLGPASTNTALCQVCTPVVNNEDSCSTIPGCVIQTGAVTVFAGTSPVLVGTLTGSALYTSVSQALETLCPTVSQTTYLTNCSTDTVTIGNIDFIDSSDALDSGGELQITVESSGYNVTSTRDAIIQSVALTVQNAATGSNCYSVEYNVEEAKKRDVGSFSWFSGLLDERDRPYPARANTTFCQTVGFASVGYYGPYWHIDDTKLPTNYIYPHLSFSVAPDGDFLCELLNEIVDAFAVVEPEFAIGDIELGEAVDLLCTDSDEGE